MCSVRTTSSTICSTLCEKFWSQIEWTTFSLGHVLFKLHTASERERCKLCVRFNSLLWTFWERVVIIMADNFRQFTELTTFSHRHPTQICIDNGSVRCTFSCTVECSAVLGQHWSGPHRTNYGPFNICALLVFKWIWRWCWYDCFYSLVRIRRLAVVPFSIGKIDDFHAVSRGRGRFGVSLE